MVLDGIAVTSTVISLMVNGMCCLWQQQEEQKLREAIRHDVRTEYWHHRQSMDLQTRIDRDEADHSPMDSNDIKYSYIQEARRKKLMIAKMKIMQQSSQVHNHTFPNSDPQVFNSQLSRVHLFHTTDDKFRNTTTYNTPNNILDCITTCRKQSASLLDDCDTDEDDFDDIRSPSFVDICLD